MLLARRVSRACALAAAILCIFVPAASAACDGESAVPAPGTSVTDLIAYNTATICVLNEARAANGLAQLQPDSRLTVAAYWHGVDMTTHHFFSHAGSDGQHVAARAVAQGFGAGADSWIVGETLGWGEPSMASPRQMVDAWLASPEHRPVVLNPAFRAVGVMVLPQTPDASVTEGVTYVADYGVEEISQPVDPEPKAKKSSLKSCRKLSGKRRTRCVRAARKAEAEAARRAQAAARRS